MKKTILAIAAAATLLTGFTLPSMASDTSSMVITVDHRRDHWGEQRRHDGNRYGHDDRRHGRGDILSPRKVSFMLRDRGYRVRDIDLRKGRYFVAAKNQHGRNVKLVVDARSGRILDVSRAGGDRRSDNRGYHRTGVEIYQSY